MHSWTKPMCVNGWLVWWKIGSNSPNWQHWCSQVLSLAPNTQIITVKCFLFSEIHCPAHSIDPPPKPRLKGPLWTWKPENPSWCLQEEGCRFPKLLKSRAQGPPQGRQLSSLRQPGTSILEQATPLNSHQTASGLIVAYLFNQSLLNSFGKGADQNYSFLLLFSMSLKRQAWDSPTWTLQSSSALLLKTQDLRLKSSKVPSFKNETSLGSFGVY